MTSLHTLPIPSQTARPHEHAWLAESRHATSEGVVVYVRCDDCDTRRVDLQPLSTLPPAAVSIELRA